jgi:hypothetical protein
MHQIAKIKHCETSILGRNGIAVKLVGDVAATGISAERLATRIDEVAAWRVVELETVAFEKSDDFAGLDCGGFGIFEVEGRLRILRR